MLKRLMRTEAVKRWLDIESAINNSVRDKIPGDGRRNSRILHALVAGEMEAWTDDENPSVAITQIIHDGLTGSRLLLIYAAYAPESLPEGKLSEGLTAISRHARRNNCSHLYFVTEDERLVKFARRNQGKIESGCYIPVSV